jgi:hypothetical protein
MHFQFLIVDFRFVNRHTATHASKVQSQIANQKNRKSYRCPGGFEPATSTFTASHASRLHHGHSASTRIRTRNPLLEARDDLRFTIEAQEWTAGESNPDSLDANQVSYQVGPAAHHVDGPEDGKVRRNDLRRAAKSTKKTSHHNRAMACPSTLDRCPSSICPEAACLSRSAT